MKSTIYKRAAWLLALAGCCTPQLFGQGFGGFGGFGGNNNNSSTRSSSRSTTSYPNSTDIGQARITYDPETRNLIVVADEETADHIKGVVKQLDRPAPQVLIKVIFLEVTYSKGSNIGITGSYKKNFFPSTLDSSTFSQGFGGLPDLASGAGTYTVLAKDFNATISALAEDGKLEVLSRPTILARNNQQATITVGQQVPLITNVRYDNFGNQINGITYQDVGIILRVTPFITSDGLVEMILAPEISSVSDSSVNISSGTNGVAAPIINIRSADTVVVTPNSQTVIIGGLMSNKKTSTVSKVPLLGDIPVLGNLFRHTVKNNEKTELMIFLTPTIVRDPHDLVAMAQTSRNDSQITTNAFSEKEVDRYLDQKPEDKYKYSEPPPANK